MEPEKPLKVMDIYKDRCHLSWEPPKDDGGLGIDYYLVESMDVESSEWTVVGHVPGDTQCGVPNLKAGKKYRFRVRAVNAAGESQPLVNHEEVLAKDPWGKYFAPLLVFLENFSIIYIKPVPLNVFGALN